jgi:hypothetical protein
MDAASITCGSAGRDRNKYPNSNTSPPGSQAVSSTVFYLDKTVIICDQAFFVSTLTWQSTLCGSVLAQKATNPSLRNLELTTHKVNAGPPT